MKMLDINRAGMAGRASGAGSCPAGFGGLSLPGVCVFQTNRLHSLNHRLPKRVKQIFRQM